MDYSQELKTACDAVERACRLCAEVQNSAAVRSVEKEDKSPVTIADFGSQALICSTLHKVFPHDRIVGEEDAGVLRQSTSLADEIAGLAVKYDSSLAKDTLISSIDAASGEADYTGRYWTVDPIDGTKGFLRGEQYAVALALVENGRVVLGILGCPNYVPARYGGKQGGSLFYGVMNEGSRLMNLHDHSTAAIQVDGITDPASARFCESVERAHASHEEHAKISNVIGLQAEPFRIDSQAKYAAVSCGEASLYLRLPRSSSYREKIWDHAAGSIVVTEAGGRVTDFSGRPLDFTLGRKLEDNYGILASNGCLHEKALAAIESTVM